MPRQASGACSEDPDVPVPVRGPPLALAELGFLDRRHDRPVVPDRAALESPPAEAKRLEGHAGNPERPEQVALAAADDQVAAERVAAQPHRKRLHEERGGDDQRAAATAHRHIVAKTCRLGLNEPSAEARRPGDPTSPSYRTTLRPS